MLSTSQQWILTPHNASSCYTLHHTHPTQGKATQACIGSMHMRLCMNSQLAAACRQRRERFDGGPACCGPWPPESCPRCSCSSLGPQSEGHRHTPSSGSVQPLCTAWLLYACNSCNNSGICVGMVRSFSIAIAVITLHVALCLQ